MSVAYFPVLFPEIPGYDPSVFVSGKALAHAMPALDLLAHELGVPELMSFYSESLAESFGHIGEEVPDDMLETPITWTDAEDGLHTVRAIVQHLLTCVGVPLLVKDPSNCRPDETVVWERVFEDLKQLETVLVTAKNHGSKFRLKIDM